MKIRLVVSALAAGSVALISLWAQTADQVAVSPAGGSQNVKGKRKGPVIPQGPTPHLADGKVDLSGVWNGGGPVGDLGQGMAKDEKIPLNADGEKVMKSRKSNEDPEANCLPTGIPRIAPYPWRIVQTNTHVFFLFEGNIHSFRQIFTDGRKHTDDPDPSWYGESVGRYEGADTLVVDSIGFNDKFWFDFRGHPHSEKLHTVERYTRTSLGQLEVETLIEDPVYYTKPFKVKFNARLMPNTDLMEYICQENNQDVLHIQGPAGTP